METTSKKLETCIVAIKFAIIKPVRNENKCRIFNNEHCLGLAFEVLARAFFNIQKNQT